MGGSDFPGRDPPGGDLSGGDLDEFGEIARLWRPLTCGAPEALDLLDDAAVLPPQPHGLVVTTDTLVEGVHFLPDDPIEDLAAKLLAVNLSDLAAKAAEPYGWLLTAAWPARIDAGARARFASALGAEQARFGLSLFGGDTVRTPGPLTLGAVMFGRAGEGGMVRRAGARPGDDLWVSGAIGDAGLGLRVLTGALAPPPAYADWLIGRYRRPEPRLALRDLLRSHAAAAADVSDGLLADAGRIAEASGCAVEVRLERTPLSAAGRGWSAAQADPALALATLATAGDDYEVVLAARPDRRAALAEAAALCGVALTRVGRFEAGAGVSATFGGAPVAVRGTGWRHGASSTGV